MDGPDDGVFPTFLSERTCRSCAVSNPGRVISCRVAGSPWTQLPGLNDSTEGHLRDELTAERTTYLDWVDAVLSAEVKVAAADEYDGTIGVDISADVDAAGVENVPIEVTDALDTAHQDLAAMGLVDDYDLRANTRGIKLVRQKPSQ